MNARHDAGQGRLEQGARPGGRSHGHEAEDSIDVFSAEAMRLVDQDAHRVYGLPALVLMENAARELATCGVELLEDLAGVTVDEHPPVVIYVGLGNNGADGFAAARHLHNAGAAVMVIKAAGAMSTEEGRIHQSAARAMGIPIIEAAEDGSLPVSTAGGKQPGENSMLVIDALLGTGLTSAPRPGIAKLIDRINRHRKSGSIILSADIPSGMVADTGQTPGPCVQADATLTFGGLKLAFLSLEAQPFLGNIAIGDIGVPRELLGAHARRMGKPAHFESLDSEPPPLDDHGVHPGPA
ncbi:MAG TPA: NAD(P)H-hydrate epimerase [Phycisphaerales bacterium]|nr:NAD(P)H-hydrate epimerase [Phycisphaerales bacterium]